jgi:hypothetical protein
MSKIIDTINDTEALKIIQDDEYKLYMKALCWIASQYVSKIRVQFAKKAFEMYKDETVRKIVLAAGIEHDKLEASRLRNFIHVAEYGACTDESLTDDCLNCFSDYANTVKMLFCIKL